MIFNKDIKATNYNIDTINSKTYIFGIAITQDEKRKVIEEAKGIYGLEEVVPSIILVEDLQNIIFAKAAPWAPATIEA